MRPGSWLVAAIVSAVLPAAVALAARLGARPLLIAVVVLQLLAVAAVLATRPPSPRAVAAVAGGALVAADVVAGRASSLAPLGGVVGLSVLATVVVQLTRGVARARVTEAMSSTLCVVLGTVALATLLVLERRPDGTAVIAAYGLACAVALVDVACLDRARPAAGARRPLVGATAIVLAGVATAALTGLLAPHHTSLSGLQAGLIGGSVALVAVVMDFGASMAGGVGVPDPPLSLQSAAAAAAPLLGLVAAAPVAYLLGILIVG